MNNPNLKNEPKSFSTEHFNDNKLSKQNELNESMTITNSQPDEYERQIMNLGGRGNAD